MEEQKKYDLFDRYLRGELEQKELDSFLEKLGSDEALKEEFDMYHYLVEGIREHEKKELKAFMSKKAGVRYIGSPWSKNFTYASAAILIGFGVLYFVLDNREKDSGIAGNDPIEIKKTPEGEQVPDPGQIKKEDEPDQAAPGSVPEIKEEDPSSFEKGAEKEDEVQEEAPEFPLFGDPNRMAGSKTENSKYAGDGDFPVKADTRIMDTLVTLAIVFETEEGISIDTGTGPLTQTSATLLNEKILVQFWKSPINYKGYRFDGRKLVLFGLDSISMVELKYRVLDADLMVYDIYLVYGKLHVKLIDDNRYNAYTRETNPAILNELK